MVVERSPRSDAERLAEILGLVSDLDLSSVLREATALAVEWTGAERVAIVLREQVRGVPPVTTREVPDTEVLHLLRSADEGDPQVVRAVIAHDGEPFADVVLATTDEGGFDERGLAAVAGLAQVTGVAVRNARSFAVSERRRQWAEATARVTESLHPPYLLVDPLNRIVEGAQQIAHAGLVAIARAGDGGYDVPAARSERPGTLPALLDSLRAAIASAQTTGEPFEAPHGDHGTVAGFPLHPELAFEGVVILVTDHGRGTLPAEDRSLLASFVTHGSLVLDRAVLLAERQHEVVAADRDRIARDLHDVVIQRLFATGMKLQATQREAGETGERIEGVDEVVRDLDVTIRDIRSTIFELEHAQESSLRAGVAALVREYEPALGFVPRVRTWGPINSFVSPALAEQALVVLREGLANVARHARASTCRIEVQVEDGWLRLDVADDGVGMGEPGPDVRRSGLRNLDKRATGLGGRLEVRDAAPHGTRLSWRVPTDLE